MLIQIKIPTHYSILNTTACETRRRRLDKIPLRYRTRVATRLGFKTIRLQTSANLFNEQEICWDLITPADFERENLSKRI